VVALRFAPFYHKAAEPQEQLNLSLSYKGTLSE